MSLKTYPICDYPGSLWENWDRLNEKYYNAHPLLQSRFVEPLSRYFPANIEILTDYERGKYSIMILLEVSNGLVQSAYHPAQSQIALMLAPQKTDDHFNLDRAQVSTDVLRLDLFAIDPKYQRSVVEIPGLELTVKSTNTSIDVTGCFADYWGCRPKNLRKNISRYKNRVAKELGDYTFNVLNDAQDVRSAIDKYGLLESKGWKGISGTSLHPDNVQGRFYREVMEAFALSGDAYVLELWTAGRLVSSRLCISNGDLFVVLKTTYDEALKRYAFGRLLLFEMIRYVFENKVAKTIDFYTSATDEQLDWGNQSREFYDGSLYKGKAGALLKYALKARKLFY